MTTNESVPSAAGLWPLIARQFGAFVLLWGALAAWWYPAPLLIQVREVDWGERYQRAYAPSRNPLFGAMEMGREVVRLSRPVLSLPRFIEQETAGDVLEVKGDGWQRLLRRLRRTGPKETVYLTSSDSPLGQSESAGRTSVIAALNSGGRQLFLDLRQLRPDDYAFDQAPVALRYPLRARWPWLLGVGLAATLLIRWRPDSQSRLADSMIGTGLKWSFGLLAGGVVLALYPWVSAMGMDGIGVTFMGALLVLFGIIAISVVGWHAWVIAHILDGRDRLARWSYDPLLWQRFIREDLALRKEASKGLLWMVVVISVVVVGVFALAAEDMQAMGFAALVVVATLGLATAAAFGGQRAMRRRYSVAHPELMIGRRGLWLNGITHVWRGFSARLEGVEVGTREGLGLLCIRYSVLQSSGPRSLMFYRREETVCVPIPQGRLDEAREVAKCLS